MQLFDFRHRLENAVWRDREATGSRWQRLGLRLIRTVAVLFRDNTRGELTFRAMGLVYTTLLSLVPLLALSFSVLKAFGVHNQIRPFLQGVLAPLGESSEELTQRVIIFIENMNVGVLGSLGLALLLFTAISLVQKVEEAFNFIWHISQPRSFGERFSRYLTLLLVGPILVFSAMGITASIMSADIVQRLATIEPFGRIFVALGQLTPYLLVIIAFTIAYYFIPNTQVRLGAALIGGVVAGVAWQTAGWIFAEFAASSRQYRAIYSGFAILILFMIWLYLSWRIVLFGASVSFYYQRPEYLTARSGEPRLSNRLREYLALGIVGLLAGRFRAGDSPLPGDEMARELRVPGHVLQIILDELEGQGLLARVGGASGYYLPTRDFSTISLYQIVDSMRSAGETGYLSSDNFQSYPPLVRTIQKMEGALADALNGFTAADIAVIHKHQDDQPRSTPPMTLKRS